VAAAPVRDAFSPVAAYTGDVQLPSATPAGGRCSRSPAPSAPPAKKKAAMDRGSSRSPEAKKKAA